jgi:hypothetical protein
VGDRQQGERRRQEERIGARQAGKPCLVAQGREARRQSFGFAFCCPAVCLGKESGRHTQTECRTAPGCDMTGAKRQNQREKKYWSAEVAQKSDALDLEPGVFSEDDPKHIAHALKASAERSKRRKAGPYQSAMSMLNFFVNRAGRNLPAERKRILEKAKVELRRAFGKD